MIDLKALTIQKAHQHLIAGDFTVLELAQSYLAEIEQKNGRLNAYLEVFDDVKEQAAIAQKRIAEKRADILTGIPLAVKDNILIAGKRASSASKILEGFVAPYDATAISKLKAAGAIFLGRANMDEFAMGGSTENSAFGVTRNPYDEERVAGGSSGGSAAAVAMNGAMAALGSDTGGSVRQPGSFCGLVGLKPTYGAVSRYGLMAMGSSLDQIGPLTRTVSDAEIIFNTIKGKDVMDATTIESSSLTVGSQPLRIGVPKECLETEGMSEVVRKNFKESLEKLKAFGHTIHDISIPSLPYSLAVYYVIMPAEASSNLARFDGVKYGLRAPGADLLGDYMETRGRGFGAEVRRRILIGTYVLSSGYYDAYYNRAQAVRGLLRADFQKAFESVDVVATPTAPTLPWKIGEKSRDPLAMYLEDIFTVPANIVGIPALSVPSGFADVAGRKLPLGLQLMASYGKENTLFEVGKSFLGED